MSATDLLRSYKSILDEAENADINQIASGLEFKPVRKLPKTYEYVDTADLEQMPAMSYTVNQEHRTIETHTADGKETVNTAEPDDIIMSGPSKEKYVLKAAKFPKLYQGKIGGPVIPEQGPRMVAVYTGDQEIKFLAPWGESMVLKPNDYLVKDGDSGYYRIAKLEYEQTYTPFG
jgi:hypothetical protein